MSYFFFKHLGLKKILHIKIIRTLAVVLVEFTSIFFYVNSIELELACIWSEC